MTLGEKLCKYRRERKMSQEEVAEKLNITRQMISRWEHDTSIPDIKSIQKLSEIYRVSVEIMLKEEEDNSIEKPIVEGVKEVYSSKGDAIVPLLCSILLLAACRIPILNIILPIVVFLKFKRKKYFFWIKMVAIICLIVAIYNTYTFIDVAFIHDDGIVEIEAL